MVVVVVVVLVVVVVFLATIKRTMFLPTIMTIKSMSIIHNNGSTFLPLPQKLSSSSFCRNAVFGCGTRNTGSFAANVTPPATTTVGDGGRRRGGGLQLFLQSVHAFTTTTTTRNNYRDHWGHYYRRRHRHEHVMRMMQQQQQQQTYYHQPQYLHHSPVVFDDERTRRHRRKRTTTTPATARMVVVGRPLLSSSSSSLSLSLSNSYDDNTRRYGSSSSSSDRIKTSNEWNENQNENENEIFGNKNWRNEPNINPTLNFKTLKVPTQQVALYMKHPKLQPYYLSATTTLTTTTMTLTTATTTTTTDTEDTILSHIHPRLKIVQDFDDDNLGGSVKKKKNKPTHKLLLLWMVDEDDDDGNSNNNNNDDDDDGDHELEQQVQSIIDEIESSSCEGGDTTNGRNGSYHKNQEEEQEDNNNNNNKKSGSVAEARKQAPEPEPATFGPIKSIPITYQNLSYNYILRQLLLMPSSSVGSKGLDDSNNNNNINNNNDNNNINLIPTSYEQVGHIAHFNLREHHLPYKKLIGEVLLESATGRGGGAGGDGENGDGGRITTVVNKIGQVQGKFRTYDYEVLATSNNKLSNIDENDPALLETTVVEDGVKIHLNLAECYWCTRLGGERQTLINDILSESGANDNDHHIPSDLVVADAFCGVGAVCLLLAKEFEQRIALPHTKDKNKESTAVPVSNNVNNNRTMTIIANDWNGKAITYFNQSITSNKFRISGDDEQNKGKKSRGTDRRSSTTFELYNQESYEFLIQLGTAGSSTPSRKGRRPSKGRKKKETLVQQQQQQQQQEQRRKYPHHVLMNFPLEAPKFLGALRWWSSKRIQQQFEEDGMYPRFHVYTFARSTRISFTDTGRTVDLDDEEEVAVDLVADNMFPSMDFGFYDDSGTDDYGRGDDDDEDDGDGDGDDEDGIILDDEEEAGIFAHRRTELNDEFGCNVSTRLVRDVAPGKVVVCVSFSVTPKLVRYMQGNY